MAGKEIPDSAIELVAKHINTRSNKNYNIPIIGQECNVETPQIFEIIPFNQIDDSNHNFYTFMRSMVVTIAKNFITVLQ